MFSPNTTNSLHPKVPDICTTQFLVACESTGIITPMPGQLFTQYFLTDGIRHTAEWHASVGQPQDFTAFASGVTERVEAFCR